MDEEALVRKAADLLGVAAKVIAELRDRRDPDDDAGADFEPPSLVEKVAIAQFVAQVAAAERLIAQEEVLQRAAQSAPKNTQEQIRQPLSVFKDQVHQTLPAVPQPAPPPKEGTAAVGWGLWPLVSVFRTEEGIEVEVLEDAGNLFVKGPVVFLCRTPQELSEAFRKTADLLAVVLTKNP